MMSRSKTLLRGPQGVLGNLTGKIRSIIAVMSADREQDVIRRRGENVSSIEVKAVINAHPKMLESAVIGVIS